MFLYICQFDLEVFRFSERPQLNIYVGMIELLDEILTIAQNCHHIDKTWYHDIIPLYWHGISSACVKFAFQVILPTLFSIFFYCVSVLESIGITMMVTIGMPQGSVFFFYCFGNREKPNMFPYVITTMGTVKIDGDSNYSHKSCVWIFHKYYPKMFYRIINQLTLTIKT